MTANTSAILYQYIVHVLTSLYDKDTMQLCTCIICTFNIQEQANCKEYDGSSEDLVDPLEPAVLSPALVGEDYGDAHDPDEPRKDKISHSEAIPLAVVEEPVTTTTVVDKDHYHQGETVLRWGKGRKRE